MERKDQLRNVAFGGAWSEEIAGREALAAALALLDELADEAEHRDIRDDREALAALELAARDHPKGQLLRAAWIKAAGYAECSRRCTELADIATRLRVAQLGRLKAGRG